MKNEMSHLLTLKDIQSVSLDILKEFDKFCRENNLRYSLAYGTLIGAVRHKGFIPWDDDVDVVMPRPDYNKFIALYNDNDNYACFAPEKFNCFLAYGRLAEMKRTKVITPAVWADKDTGVWIDIMPLDGVEESEEEFQKSVSRAYRLWMRVYYARVAYSGFTHCDSFMSFLKYVVKKVFFNNIYKYLYLHLCVLHRFDYVKCKYISNMSHLLYTKKSHFRKEIFSNVVRMSFENSDFMVMNGWDAFLHDIYGNYMQLPPKEQQVVGHAMHRYLWRT